MSGAIDADDIALFYSLYLISSRATRVLPLPSDTLHDTREISRYQLWKYLVRFSAASR